MSPIENYVLGQTVPSRQFSIRISENLGRFVKFNKPRKVHEARIVAENPVVSGPQIVWRLYKDE